MSSEALEHAHALLNSLCEDALEAPLAHAYGLNRDGLLQDYAQSCDFFALAATLDALLAEEQRLREGLTAVLRQLDRLLPGFVTGEVSEAKALARAALVDEPAAATLAEPEPQPTEARDKRTAESRPTRLGAPVPAPSGSASAAADEPPQWWPNNETGGAQTTPFPTGGNAGAAADEPGETP